MDINDWPLNMQPFAFTEQPTAGTKRPNPSLPYENPVTKRPYLQFNSQGKTVDLLGSVDKFINYDVADASLTSMQWELPSMQTGISHSPVAQFDVLTSATHVESLTNKCQANELLSQTRGPSPLLQHTEICTEYDTCFGVVVATPTSSFSQEGSGTHFVPVTLKPLGGTLILQGQNSNTHTGILNNTGLINALYHHPLKLDATLIISDSKEVGEKAKAQIKKSGPSKAAREYRIRIVLYGLRNHKEAIGDLLSDACFFLQHPSITEVIPGVQYDNPHYLLRPGAEMPKLKHLHQHAAEDIAPAQSVDEISKSRFLRMFETTVADEGALTMVNISPSPRLRSALMRHQIIALAMMREKESGFVEEPMFPPLWKKELSEDGQRTYYRHTITKSVEAKPISALGGILADDMGLGKTVSMLALICSSLDFGPTTPHEGRYAQHCGTLIVATKSTLYGWVDQASQHIHEGQIRVKVYHGSSRESVANQFYDTDVIVTTYETLRTEWTAQEGARPLFSWKWLRVVLDEAHHIRNRLSQTFRSTCELRSKYRWCLTGTPIHNHLDDYGALLSFIGVFPFAQKSIFMHLIVKPVEKSEETGNQRLQQLIRATCLRRTKQKTLSSGEVKLPPYSERIQEVYLHQDDQALYDVAKEQCAIIAAGLEKHSEERPSSKSKGKDILRLINSLRLICNGNQLLSNDARRMIEGSSTSSPNKEVPRLYTESRCSTCEGEIDHDGSESEEENQLCAACSTVERSSPITDIESGFLDGNAVSAQRTAGTERPNSVEVDYRPSAKVLALLENLKQEQPAAEFNCRPRKSVVFSSWVKMLDLIEQALLRDRLEFQRIDGRTTLEGRRKAMQEFDINPHCTVMLASIGACAEGVNLTAASIVHLIEPHWNPMVEAQAVDRVYRVGQTQEVTIIRYIVPNSVETYVRRTQQGKMQVIENTIKTSGQTGADMESERWERQ